MTPLMDLTFILLITFIITFPLIEQGMIINLPKGEASDLSKEYDDLDMSELNEMSGSITQINENSPFLDEIFKGDSWKKVIKQSNKKDAD